MQLRLYVPGDTSSDRHAEVYGGMVLGRAVVVVEANDVDPGAIDPAGVQAALAELPVLDAEFWREASAGIEGVEAPEKKPAAYLLSWGPLCYAGLHVGVPASRDGEPVHRFIANQDMNQEWSTQGIDGVSVSGAEFSDIVRLELPAKALAKVADLPGAGFWLICRYD
ncbi:MAG: hypothetical protein HC927_11945 [Deltaproteobacteria bacterium]|nr:hypothetical protein [Deltaproteobacteria bacterium]